MSDTLFDIPRPPSMTMLSEATISDDTLYRYELRRTWDLDPVRRVLWIMLNPSTADHQDDDRTIAKIIKFSRTWGYGGINVVNLYAWRATQPTDMLALPNNVAVGPDNDRYLQLALSYAAAHNEPVMAGWGANARPDRIAALAGMRHADRLQCLAVTKSGQPKHPLYIRDDTQPSPWKAPR